MIILAEGSIFSSEAQVWANTVNCVGVMGKGIALEFKKRFPENYESYKAVCGRWGLRPGDVYFTIHGLMNTPMYIFNVATKDHWRDPSRLEWIKSALDGVRARMVILAAKSIALPALGCGHGGLDWKDVKPLIYQTFEDLPEITVYLYPPQQ